MRRWPQECTARSAGVETGDAFHRLPSRETFEVRRDRVPPDLVAAVKASRLTRIERLNGAAAQDAEVFAGTARAQDLPVTRTPWRWARYSP
ncbi:hypothetical protein [Streptomyces sp. NPDC093094]|uniref:hypothetical protein n=1 Tax=Streptomyces sp. NPDC093094 TaxID=3366026 RepID=UPI0037FEFB74